MVRAVRGAITCDNDTPGEVNEATQELLLVHDDVISIIFTTSIDLTSAFPATCALGIGFGDIPLLCASEINVPGAMPKCIRVMLHAYTSRARVDVRHVYLRNAQSLRDALPG